jgi:hypothetical protein
MKRKYLSIVITSRNDNHGGNALARMNFFIQMLFTQSKLLDLDIEIIVVEWNPPTETLKLIEAIKWPKIISNVHVKIIEVPQKIHRSYKHSGKLPLFQMIAKNVGIRRASGDFILVTNIDILFSMHLMEFFSSRCLREGVFYRIDRYDVPNDVLKTDSMKEAMDYCRNNIIRINRFGVTHETGQSYKSSQKISDNFIKKGFTLHTNASGDFILMSQKDWLKTKGFAEFEMYSFRIDSLFCYTAFYSGIKELVLEDPMRIYHIEHEQGSGWTPGNGVKKLNERLTEAGIPQISCEQKEMWQKEMIRSKKPIFFNGSDWGLMNEVLPETTL